MIKKIIISIVLLSNMLFAINVGDKISDNLQKELNIKDNKIYVIDFFASWCVSCKIELPLISEVNNNIDKSKYKIIGINVDEDESLGKSFVEDLNLKFDIIYDPNNKIISSFAPIGIPAIYFIKDLQIKKVIFGAVHGIDKKIINTLNELQ